MKKLSILRIVVILLSILAILASSSPVYATGPEKTQYVFDNWYTKTDICSFTIQVHETGSITEKNWRDEDGNIVRKAYAFAGNVYYLTANNKTATVTNNGKIEYDYISAEETRVTVSGQEWVWSIPGQGKVSGEVGRQEMVYIYQGGVQVGTVVEKLVGKIMPTDVTVPLCAYLDP